MMDLLQGSDVFHGMSGATPLSWLSMKASAIGDFGDFAFFHFVLERLQHDVTQLGQGMMGRMMALVGLIATSVLTIWILIQGYRMVTGQMRESAVALVTNTARAVVIVSVALSFSLFNTPLQEFLTGHLQSDIYELVTGNTGSPGDEIDQNLGWMQVAMSSMDALDPGMDEGVSDQKGRITTMIGVGSGGPALVAGALLLMYQVAMALFIGLGPLFILCLLFDFTKSLFQKWLFYGIGTMFSMAVLAAMTSIALKMVTDVAMALWGSDVLNTVLLGGDAVSYSSRAIQQGGMGVILTLLLITVPPMAGNFFQGTLGSFMHFSVFGGMGGGGSPGPQGQRPGRGGIPRRRGIVAGRKNRLKVQPLLVPLIKARPADSAIQTLVHTSPRPIRAKALCSKRSPTYKSKARLCATSATSKPQFQVHRRLSRRRLLISRPRRRRIGARSL